MNKQALREYFANEYGKPQKLGTIDCVRFVTDAVRIGWDRDYVDVLQYSDRRSAVDRLRELGGLRGACTHALGPMYPVDQLAPGDVIWFDKPATIGLLMHEYVAVKMGRCIHRFQIENQMMGWKTNGR